MALITADRVREFTSTNGTGTLNLSGAAVGYQTFSSAIGNGNTCYYAIYNPGINEWEVGIGTVGAATLARTTVLKSSNSNTLVNFSAGTKDVFVTYPAEYAVFQGGAFSGTGITGTQVNITGQGDLRLEDTTGGEYVALQAPATLAASYTLTLPVDDGTNGQALITDGSGNLSWSTAASGDVYGPASATDNAVSRFDGTTGKLIQNSVVTIGDTGDVAGVGAISMSGAITLSGGTANGVAYLNGSKVLTTGSALTFDGTTLGVSTANYPQLTLNSSNSNGASVFFNEGGTNKAQIGHLTTINGLQYATIGDYPHVFYTSTNVEQMRLTSTGLGIGISSPGAKLHVFSTSALNSLFGTSNATGSYIQFNLGNSGATDGYFGSANQIITTGAQGELGIRAETALVFSAGGATERMRLDSSGNLGLGVTPSAWGSSWKVIDQTAYAGLAAYSGGTGDYGLVFNAYNDNTNWKYKYTGGESFRYRLNQSGHAWYTAPSGTAGNPITFTQAMTLDASGNLGLGTSGSFTGAGRKALSLNDTSGNLSILEFGVSNSLVGYMYANTTQMTLDTAGSRFMSFITNATERMRIDSSGNVGIGTTSPLAKLHVYGGTTVAILQRTGTGPCQINVGDSNLSNIYYDADNHYFRKGSGASVMNIDSSGNLGLGVTPSAWGSGNVAIQLFGGSIYSGSANNFRIVANAYSSATGFKYVNNGYATYYSQNDNQGSHIWQTAPSGTAGDAISFTQAMTLDASGNLMVGGTTANSKLTIGNSDATATISPGGINTNFTIRAMGADGALIFGAGGVANGNPGTERMRIDSSGNVLIGGTSALNASKLLLVGDVNGEVTQSILNRNDGADANARLNIGNANYTSTEITLTAYSDTASGTVCGVSTAKLKAIFDNSASTASSGLLIGTSATAPLYFSTSATERMRIDSSGILLVGTTTTANKAALTGSIGTAAGFANTIALGTVAQNATVTATLPGTTGLAVVWSAGNNTGMFTWKGAGGSSGCYAIWSTNGSTDFSFGSTTEPSGGNYGRLWISGGNQISFKNVSSYTGPYYICVLASSSQG